MRPEDWDRAEEWFHRLAPLEASARADALDGISNEDPELRRIVASLLEAHDSDGVLDGLAAKLSPVPLGPAALPDVLSGTSDETEGLGAGGGAVSPAETSRSSPSRDLAG